MYVNLNKAASQYIIIVLINYKRSEYSMFTNTALSDVHSCLGRHVRMLVHAAGCMWRQNCKHDIT